MILPNSCARTAFIAGIAGEPDRSVPTALGGQLTRSEWEIVELARWDGPRSLKPKGWLARMERVVFGMDLPLPLANKRLESLRRFSVRAWFWKQVRETDLRTLLEAGYSSDQARRIIAHVARHRGFAPSVEFGLT